MGDLGVATNSLNVGGRRMPGKKCKPAMKPKKKAKSKAKKKGY